METRQVDDGSDARTSAGVETAVGSWSDGGRRPRTRSVRTRVRAPADGRIV